jgi:tetratricopeptide (TPR) repeat protein
MYARLNLGIIAANRGSKGEALGYVERALAGAQEAGSPWDAAVARADLADVVLQCGDPARALAELEAAEAIRSPAGDPAHLVQWSLIGMRACLGLGRLKDAEARYRRACEAARGGRSPVTDALVAAAGAEVALRAGRLPEATRLARAAAGFHRRGLGDFREGANSLLILGEVLAATGKRRGAVRALEEAAGRYERLGSMADAARCRALLGRA